MSDVSAITPSVTSINALAALVVVSPQVTLGYQPQNFPTQDGNTTQKLPSPIMFHYEGEQRVKVECDITDHYAEDNTALQDQIAIKPTIITTHGFIGELNDVPPIAAPFLKAARDKLTIISAYQPQLTATAIIAYNQAFAAYQLASNIAQAAVQNASTIAQLGGDTGAEAVINGNGIVNPNFNGGIAPTPGSESAFSSGNIFNNANQTKQQIVFQQWYAYMQERRLFTVQTPWAIFEDMAIMSMESIQGEETVMITDFSMTFKQMRFAASDSSILINENDFSNRSANQAAQTSNLGQNATSKTDLTPASMVKGIAS